MLMLSSNWYLLVSQYMPCPRSSINTRFSSLRWGTSVVITGSFTMRSGSTLVCFKLCSSAWGTPRRMRVMKIAVPSTRVTRRKLDSMNKSSGIASALTWLNSISLPRFQVISNVKVTTAMASGNQPPCAVLVILAVKKAKSIETKRTAKGIATHLFQRHSNSITSMSNTVSIIIVQVTATPYAAARLLDDWKPNTSTTVAVNNVQFTKGT